jgi:DNA-binding winged helix-turn-helix (wHTH) protein
MRIAFGPFIVETGPRQLLLEDVEVPLSAKAFDVLLLLIDRRPDVVDKETIMSRVWSDAFVSDASLTVVLSEIRKALRDSPEQPKFIRTVHRKGYAFCGMVVATPPTDPDGNGQARFWLVINDRPVILSRHETTIGRAPACDVLIDLPQVSARHARITIQGNAATIEDLNSRNGTFVGGVRVNGPSTIVPGDTIHLGDVALNVGGSSDATVKETTPIKPKRR